MSGAEGAPSPEEQAAVEEEIQSQGAAVSTAMDRARHQDQLDREEFIDRLRDADVDGSVIEDLESQLGPELSGVYPIANWGDAEFRRAQWLNENKAERVISEQNPGRLCEGPLLELAQGTHERPDKFASRPRTADEERTLREALTGVKTAMQSLAKGGDGLSAVSEITAVTEHRRRGDGGDGNGGSSSRVERLAQKVFS